MCNCIDVINKLFADRDSNTMIHTPVTVSLETGLMAPKRVAIVTVKRDPSKKQKPASLYAPLCPFCGEKYESDPSRLEAETQE